MKLIKLFIKYAFFYHVFLFNFLISYGLISTIDLIQHLKMINFDITKEIIVIVFCLLAFIITNIGAWFVYTRFIRNLDSYINEFKK